VYDKNCAFVKAWNTHDVYVLTTDKFENAPHGVGVDPDGYIVSVDYNGQCFKYDPNGNLMFSFAYYGRYHAMTVDKFGNVYLTARDEDDTVNCATIDKYDKMGRRILSYSIMRDDGKIGYPKCLVVDSDTGIIYSTDDIKDSGGYDTVDIIVPIS